MYHTHTHTLVHIKRLGIGLHKYDEMETLVRGVQFFCRHSPNECYYWENPTNPALARKKVFHFDPAVYPFIIVNIGSGVSILHVTGPSQFKRIGGKAFSLSLSLCFTYSSTTYFTSLCILPPLPPLLSTSSSHFALIMCYFLLSSIRYKCWRWYIPRPLLSPNGH